jgi:hypothetical protein
MKTKVLDSTVYKISTLIQKGFGIQVALNLADNVVMNNDSLIDPIMPG